MAYDEEPGEAARRGSRIHKEEVSTPGPTSATPFAGSKKNAWRVNERFTRKPGSKVRYRAFNALG